MTRQLLVILVAAALGATGGLISKAALRRSGQLESTRPPAGRFTQLRGPGLGIPVAAAAVGGLLAYHLGWSAELPVWLYLGVAGVHLSFVDVRTRRLPAAVVNPSYAVVAAGLLAAAAATSDWAAAARAAGGWAAAGGLFLLVWLIQPAGLGYGDVRLAGLLGMPLAWLGWAELLTALTASLLLAAAGSLLRLHRGRADVDQLPFGPCLLAGALLAVALSPGGSP